MGEGIICVPIKLFLPSVLRASESLNDAIVTGILVVAEATTALRTFAAMPPLISPDWILFSISLGQRLVIVLPCVSSTPCVSVRKTRRLALITLAIPAAAVSALTFKNRPRLSKPIEASTGKNPTFNSVSTNNGLPSATSPTQPGS